jgi:hypothetical protein
LPVGELIAVAAPAGPATPATSPAAVNATMAAAPNSLRTKGPSRSDHEALHLALGE